MIGRRKKGFTLWTVAAALLLCVLVCAGGMSFAADEEITARDQLNRRGMKIGVGTGSASALLAEKAFPEATFLYLSNGPDVYEMVAQGKIDAFVYDRVQMQLAIDNGFRGVHLLDDTLDEGIRVAVGISPNSAIPDLRNKMNAFIAEKKADGTLDDMYERWVIRREETIPEIEPASEIRCTLTVGTSGLVPPYSFYSGTELNGYDIELAYRFAAWLGAEVSFQVFDYGSIIAAAATGSVDCIMANLNVTEERAEAIPFSDPLYTEQIGIMVRGDARTDAPSFAEQIRSSFHKTFIREGRWRLFLEGVLTTLLITVLSILFGTALGFCVCLLCRNGNRFADKLTKILLWLIQGTPMVVFLMILYYIVFRNARFSSLTVAVIGFSLTFGAGVYGLLKVGIGAVGKGQYEAARSLGQSERQTFFWIILPQALPHALPGYKGEIIGLIKATSIVGYIAVNDLTKMGDIVRSRTYEAFFPLIAVTLIYFALEALLAFLVSRIHIGAGPGKRRPNGIMKGVKTRD